MKLYAESLQGKLDDTDKKNKELDKAYKDMIDKLRLHNEELKRENTDMRKEYDRMLVECRALRDRNVSTLEPSFSTNKSRPYITLYET